MSEHSILPPSSMFRTVACPGWIQNSMGVMEEEGEAAREGTAAHFVGEQLLNAMVRDRHLMTSADFVGKEAPNGVIITGEMFEGAMIYYRAVMDIAGKGLMNQLNVEKRLSCSYLHKQCWGTPDAWLWDLNSLTLHLWDYKFGHRRIRPMGNYQAITYVVGILDELTKGDPLGMHGIKVCIHIVQPRCYDEKGPVTTWSMLNHELRPMVNQIQAACIEALTEQPAPRVRVSVDGCRHCPARGQCPALRDAAMDFADFAQESQVALPSDGALSYELAVLTRAMALLKARHEALSVDAEMRLRQGRQLNGWHLEEVSGREAWTTPVADVISIGSLMGVDLAKPQDAVTPNQAKQALKAAGIDPSVITGYYERKPGGHKLAPTDTTEARLIFQ